MEQNKKEIEIDADKLIIRVYNKIALWNNMEATNEEKSITLKVLSHDIVSDVIATAFSRLDGAKVKEKVVKGKEKEKGFWRKLLSGD